MQRCCPRGGASIASSSSSSGSSNPPSFSSEMWRPLLSGLQRRRAARRLPPRGLLDGLSPFRAISSSSSSPLTSSSSTPPPPAPPPPQLDPLPAALARARARAATPELTFHVAGVSFEGRQRAASSLRRSQPLALRRERRNAFDPRAVAVETLDGRKRIGYVPRAETDGALPGDADAAFACVRSVGRALLKEEGEGEEEEEGEQQQQRGERRGGEEGGEGNNSRDFGGGGDEEGEEERRRERLGPWGVSVSLKPGLAPLEIDALPAAIAAAGPLSLALPEREWRRLAKEAAVASGFRCAVTGGVGGGGRGAATTGEGEGGDGGGGEPRSAPVEAHEHWRVDDEGRVATLLAVRALCPEAHDVAHALSLQSPEAKSRALLTLRTVNGWSAEDARLYWRGREELAASRSSSSRGDGDGGGGGSSKEEEQPKPRRAKTEKGTPSPPPPPSSWRIDARWLVSRGVDLEQLSPAWRELLA